MCEVFKFILSNLEGIASFITAIVAIAAYLFSKQEYGLHVVREKAATLAKYNERYATDPNVQKVVNFLLWLCDGMPNDWAKNKVVYGADCKENLKPTKNQVEMFLRFFEELQVSLDAGRLDKDVVTELFAYYAEQFDAFYDKEEKLKKEMEDLYPSEEYFKDNDWYYFHKFVGRKVKNS